MAWVSRGPTPMGVVLGVGVLLGGAAWGGEVNPAAPAETVQFGFLVGRWECTTRFLRPDGSGYNEGEATWTGRYILDGWAIQDDWVSELPGGGTFHGTNLRSFNPKTGKWDNRWLPAGSLQWKYYEAEAVGDTMVMTGGEGTDARGAYLDRNTFYDITADSWRWRKDRSYDGGKTWFEGIGFIEARRAAPAAGGALPPVAPEWDFEPARQFDFWVGEWDVNLRIRQEDLTWKDSVAAEAWIYRILGGKAILELWDSEPIKGFSLRTYDRDKGAWLLWLNWPGKNRSGGSSLEGSFRHGRGDFYGTFTTQDGKEGISRYSFNDIQENRLRWDDAYSTDGGRTWSGKWIMEFTRKAPAPPWPIAGDGAHTYGTGERCDLEGFRVFEALAGEWSGSVDARDDAGEWVEAPATLRGHEVLGGCGVITFLEYETDGRTRREFGFRTYNTYAGKLEENTLDDRPGTGLVVLYGDARGGTIELAARGDGTARVVWDLAPGRRVAFRRTDADENGGWTRIRRGEFRPAPSRAGRRATSGDL